MSARVPCTVNLNPLMMIRALDWELLRPVVEHNNSGHRLLFIAVHGVFRSSADQVHDAAAESVENRLSFPELAILSDD